MTIVPEQQQMHFWSNSNGLCFTKNPNVGRQITVLQKKKTSIFTEFFTSEVGHEPQKICYFSLLKQIIRLSQMIRSSQMIPTQNNLFVEPSSGSDTVYGSSGNRNQTVLADAARSIERKKKMENNCSRTLEQFEIQMVPKEMIRSVDNLRIGHHSSSYQFCKYRYQLYGNREPDSHI